MNAYLYKSLPFYVFVLMVLSLLLIPSFSDNAHAQCFVGICKASPDLPMPESEEDAVFFPFTVSQGDVSSSEELAANALCIGIPFVGNDLEIVEDPFPGWILSDIECSDAAGVNVTFIDNGISLDCIQGSEITCTFTNVRGSTPTDIPTLSEWGMIAAAGGLALVGVFFALRRRKARAV